MLRLYKTKDKANSKATKYKVTLGIMPSYSDFNDGLHIDGVIENKPAMLSGIEAGDIIIQIEDVEIKNYSNIETALKRYNNQHKRVYINRYGQTLMFVIQ